MARQSTVIPWLAAALCAGVATAYGMVAIALGQDANWDLRNYHFYNPYAFLTGRRDFDIVPAHVATFYNPLLHLPFYGLVTTLPPRAVGFTLGVVQGLNMLLLLPVAWWCLAPLRPAVRLPAAGALAVLGLAGAMAVSEIGTSFGDNVVSLLVLAALAVLVGRLDLLAKGRLLPALLLAAAAGLPAGLGAGLKQPTVVFAVGLCAACFAVPGTFWRRFLLAFCFGLGVLAGIAVSDGFWLADMWQRYGNPLFPYFNELFSSPWATIGDYKDNRFVPNEALEVLLFPYLFTFGAQGVSEIAFFDLRPVIAYTLFLVWPVAAVWRRLGRRDGGERRPALTRRDRAHVVLTMVGVSWLVWMALFGIYRYMVPVEMLLPLAVVLLVDRWPAGIRARSALAGLLLVAAAVTVQPGIWGRVAWGESYFGVPVPPLDQPAQTIVLMAGHDATAYVVPAFPPGVRFVRIQGWFTGPSPQPNSYDRLMQDLLRRHEGPLYVLFREREERQTAIDALAAFGLSIEATGCRALHTELERAFRNPLGFCPVRRLSAARQSG